MLYQNVNSLPSIGRFMLEIGQKRSFLEVHTPVGKFQNFPKFLFESCSEFMFSSFPHPPFFDLSFSILTAHANDQDVGS